MKKSMIGISILAIGLTLAACPDQALPPITSSVIYDGNGHSGGTVPVDTKGYGDGDLVTVLGNVGGLLKTNVTFSDWNTQPDGLGVDRAAGSSFTMGSSDVTLYAKWTTYLHTITIDGANDFLTTAERFGTSTMDGNPTPPDNSYYGFVCWDASYLYVGLQGPDVASNNPDKLWLLYIGGTPGATSGYLYGTQQPSLPFAARWHLHWGAANNDVAAYVYNSGWTDAGWNFTGDVSKSGSYVEMRVPLADIGTPNSVQLHMSVINRTTGSESSYGAAPSASFIDGADPDYQSYFEFDLTAGLAPNAYMPR
jgi:hypothetical protein